MAKTGFTEQEREEAEWALSQVLLNPVLFREFINEDDPAIGPLEEHERAWTACKASRMAMCCGRSVHKLRPLYGVIPLALSFRRVTAHHHRTGSDS